jgi:hypothetical protein
LEARAGKGNAIVTRQRTDVLINRIGDQCLTFFGLDVNEVAVAIQLGSHFKIIKREQCARSVQMSEN